MNTTTATTTSANDDYDNYYWPGVISSSFQNAQNHNKNKQINKH